MSDTRLSADGYRFDWRPVLDDAFRGDSLARDRIGAHIEIIEDAMLGAIESCRDYADELERLATPPTDEVQEAVERGAVYGGHGYDIAVPVLLAALTSASETEAAFIELMEAPDPEPSVYKPRHAPQETTVHTAWRKRKALKAAHKARYDALKG